MKQTLRLLFVICCTCTTIFAQLALPETQHTSSTEKPLTTSLGVLPNYTDAQQRHAFISSLAGNSSQALASKTTTLKQRITSLTWVDSTDWAEAAYRRYAVNFYYNNFQRGSDFDYHSMSYLYAYPLDRVPFFPYSVAPANFQSVRSDSTVRVEWCNPSNQLERRLAYGLTYNEGNNRIIGSRRYSVLCGGTLNDATKTEEAYDATGRVSERSVYYLNPSTNAWEIFGRQFFRYNATGKKLVDSVASYFGGGSGNPENRIVYTYDAMDNPVSISFEEYNAGVFRQQALLQATFYPTGEPKTIKLSERAPGGTNVVPSSLDSFGYTSGAPCFTYALVSTYAGGSSLSPAGKQLRHLNAQMKPDSISEYTYSGGQFMFSKLALYTYNSFGNPTMSRIYPAVNGGVILDTVVVERYNYQDYNEAAPTSVEALSLEKQLLLYPVPSKSILNIRCKNAAAGQQARLRIISASGQTILSENVAFNNGAYAVNVADLPPSVYHLVLDMLPDGTRFHQSFIKE